MVGEGLARWNNVHVHDLSDVYAALVNKAVALDDDAELWGARGYMFTENGEHVWSQLAKAIARRALEKGYIANAEPYSLTKEAALEVAGYEAVSWGWNSRSKAERARKYLGWKPSRPSIEESIDEILEAEWARLKK